MVADEKERQCPEEERVKFFLIYKRVVLVKLKEGCELFSTCNRSPNGENNVTAVKGKTHPATHDVNCGSS